MLSERTIEILENNDMTIHNKHEQNGEFTLIWIYKAIKVKF